ncbi:alpha-1,3-mannosyl-glyco 4-beta-n-acetylglucosaminyltransferase c [Fusarium longipes]|uniref:Alpha-1,3-mannosyl-glyco 4-beta-n-acetylglucosaminyltransferase c n=1 Tax=Fusarium longipes TaxID=694270 RepID=A0A395RNG3_9HYPO|nr:alpha-1,3-mannosyl-glyco 4-beta-n-acetylglucosaminyltransferase c [Fusarium longipes]
MLLGRNRIFFLYAFLALVWVSLFQLCRLFTYYDPSSFFYDPRKAYETRYTDLREKQAEQLIDDINHASPDELSRLTYTHKDVDTRGQNKKLCVGIPSIKREKQYFLPRALASLVEGLDVGERSALHIIVLLADDDPTSHPAFSETWLQHISDEVLLYGNISSSTETDKYRNVEPTASNPDQTLLRNDRVHRDYATLMSTCRETGAEYFILVEDDVIASRDWLGRLLDALDHLARADHSENWLYLRLFYSETYMGWNSEEWPIYLVRSLCFYTMVLTVYFVIIAVDLRRRSHLFHFKSQSYNLLHLTFWTASFIILYFLAGRLTVDPYKEGVRTMPNYGCCAQGLVIPHQHLPALEETLHTASSDIAGDSVIEKFADDHALKKYAIVPSVLQHIGIKGSSDEKGTKKATWNFSFERTGT